MHHAIHLDKVVASVQCSEVWLHVSDSSATAAPEQWQWSGDGMGRYLAILIGQVCTLPHLISHHRHHKSHCPYHGLVQVVKHF